MHSDPFDVIPYNDIKGDWKRLGAGSFGNVYKGTYLGIEVAIKEVLPSKDYDVAKYFEREWRLMKECRHPNICLFIGLSRAPPPDNRIYIISEFIENGNVRTYIHDKSKPFPWRLRLSFATDVARALAYLHARKCIHRDLKGENLLVTSNGRIKITDFGFARIAARNEEESKRLTFCGTDSYMSPEILLGEGFDLPTDIFSLGIILCEIAARKLADDNHFKRHPPKFEMDPNELQKTASSDCPPDFIKLCLECLAIDPSARPTTRDILDRLRVIEAEVLARPNEAEDAHVGSIKFLTGDKRPPGAPRIPSFGVGIGKDIYSSDESDDEVADAMQRLASVDLEPSWASSTGQLPLLQNVPSITSCATSSAASDGSDYRPTVIRANNSQSTIAQAQPLQDPASVLTLRQSPTLPKETPSGIAHYETPSSISSTHQVPSAVPYDDPLGNGSSIFSIATYDSYHTATTRSSVSSALATEGGSTIRSIHAPHGYFGAVTLMHRFTLLKPGKRNSGSASPPVGNTAKGREAVKEKDKEKGDRDEAGWKPLDLFFTSGLLVSKCDVCNKRFGWKPALECDDCGLRAHVKCGEIAPRNCGTRPPRSDINIVSSSPLSKIKENVVKRTKSPMRYS